MRRGNLVGTCEQCGAGFRWSSASKRPARFCSRECNVAHRKATISDRLRYEVEPTGCWVWQRYIDPRGYGRIGQGGRSALAHRVSYEIARGPVPPGLVLDHLCRNRACINPDHLQPVTQAVNNQRGIGYVGLNAQKTECKYGHPFSGENLLVNSKGHRRCRTCDARRAKASRDKASVA